MGTGSKRSWRRLGRRACVYVQVKAQRGEQCLVQFHIIGSSLLCGVCVRGGTIKLCLVCMATSDMAKTREIEVIGALGVGITNSSPAIRSTKLDVVGIIVCHIDDRRVGGFSSKVLEGTLTGRRGLAVDLDLLAVVEGRDPVGWPLGEGCTAGDTDVGAGVVDGQLASGDVIAVVAAEPGPLEDVDTIGDPGRDLHSVANARLGVTRIEAVHGAVACEALALDDVLIAEEVLLIAGGDVVFHGLDESHLDEATVMIVPPPLDRDLLAALEVVLVWDVGTVEATGILIGGLVGRIHVVARSGKEEV